MHSSLSVTLVSLCALALVADVASASLKVEDKLAALNVELLQSRVRDSFSAAGVAEGTVPAPVAVAMVREGAMEEATDPYSMNSPYELDDVLSPVPIEEEGEEVKEEQEEPTANQESAVHGYDDNGHVCMLCAKPLPGRSNKIYKELRTDCGKLSSKAGPNASMASFPAAKLREKVSQSVSIERNGFCQLNFAKSCVDAVANKDYLYWAKGFDLHSTSSRANAAWDARYCRLNGFLEPDIVALQHDFDGTKAKASEMCETKYQKYGLDHLCLLDILKNTRYADASAPSLEEAERVAAVNCAMGDLGCDLAFCAYSFCIRGEGTGLYDECNGWDPVHGMPIYKR